MRLNLFQRVVQRSCLLVLIAIVCLPAYALPNCSVGDFHDCIGTKEYGNGDKYEGEWREGLMHGRGKYTFADGTFYEGEWKDDKRHGRGKEAFADGRIYDGEWKEDNRHGRAKFTFADGAKYEGEFVDGLLHGQVTHTLASGEKYVGEFLKGQRVTNSFKRIFENAPAVGDNLTMLAFCVLGYADMLAEYYFFGDPQYTLRLQRLMRERSCNGGRETQSIVTQKDLDEADWRHAGEASANGTLYTVYIMRQGNQEALWVKKN